mmetsp:Transcript_123501/g.349077  ORF Transcript_123501/g.349077 Transcript_123501/m.349077 type:complete len:158 (-) Transcript_123501:298-771(-)
MGCSSSTGATSKDVRKRSSVNSYVVAERTVGSRSHDNENMTAVEAYRERLPTLLGQGCPAHGQAEHWGYDEGYDAVSNSSRGHWPNQDDNSVLSISGGLTHSNSLSNLESLALSSNRPEAPSACGTAPDSNSSIPDVRIDPLVYLRELEIASGNYPE